MDTIPPADRFRLTAWLVASHLAAAIVAAILVLRLPLPAGAALASAIGAGALVGWLLTAMLRRDVEVAALALARLVAGQPIASLPGSRRSPLAGLLRAIADLAGRERQVIALREDLVQRTGETAAQAERNRLARELHDSIKQQLYAINVSAAAALARWDTDADGARAAVEDVRGSAQAALAEMRALLQQLRPAPLATAGLLDALRDQCEALAYRTDAQVTVNFGEPAGSVPAEETPAAADAHTLTSDELPAGAQETIFRIAQEALANVARHARAAHVHLRLAREEGRLVLEVNDDGQGFDPQGTPAADGGPASPLVIQPAGLGLANMHERAAAVGGQLQIHSTPGAGTSVRLSLPLVAPAAGVKEVAMSSEVKALLQSWHRAHTVAGVAAGLCLVFLLALAPRLAAAGGTPTLSAPLLVGASLTLGAGAVALYAAARSRRAETALALILGADSPVHLGGQREAHGRQMWIYLAGILILPAALLPARLPQFPMPALIGGGLLAVVALVGIWRAAQATERYWRSLAPAELAAELAQAWSQRFTPLLVLAVTLPGYLFLRLGGAPAPFTWPPGRELVIDILATLYLNVLLVWGAVTFLQLRAWRQGTAGWGVQA